MGTQSKPNHSSPFAQDKQLPLTSSWFIGQLIWSPLDKSIGLEAGFEDPTVVFTDVKVIFEALLIGFFLNSSIFGNSAGTVRGRSLMKGSNSLYTIGSAILGGTVIYLKG